MKIKRRLLAYLTAFSMAFSMLAYLPILETRVSAASGVSINSTNFPDGAFISCVTEFDTNSDYVLSESEIAAVVNMDVGSKSISSLKGIEYFTSLKKLYCYDNNLTELDVSALTNLEKLSVSYNNLTALDVSKNTKLDYLICNGNNLTALNVANNPALVQLECDQNSIKVLDLSENTKLGILCCRENELRTLDLSNCPAVYYLKCNDNAISSLVLPDTFGISDLWCHNNQLGFLDVSANDFSLTSFYAFGNTVKVPAGSTIDLDSIDCFDGFDPSRASDWTDCTYNAATNTLTDITSDTITYTYDCGQAKSVVFTIELETIAIDATNFPDDTFRNYVKTKFDTNGD